MPDLIWKEHTYMEGHATVITHTGLQDILDLLANDTQSERVLAHTLRKMTERNKRALAQQIQEMALQTQWGNADQQLIADYLNGLKYNLFDVKPHFYDALDLATRLDTENGTHQHEHVRTLLDIRDMPKEFYTPIAESKSARVFGTSLQFLQSDIRRALYPEWVELDMKHCHLSIIAYLFDTPLTRDFLENGRSFWTDAMDFMEIETDKYHIAKPSIKTCLYSIVFGMEPYKAQNKLDAELKALKVQWHNDFIAHPIVVEVSDAVDIAKESIKAHHGMAGAYGFISKGTDDAKSILSCVVQSYELALIAPIYRIALEERESKHVTFDIVLHSHDGVSILVKDGADIHAIQRKVQNMVSLQAEEYGMKVIGIEVKE